VPAACHNYDPQKQQANSTSIRTANSMKTVTASSSALKHLPLLERALLLLWQYHTHKNIVANAEAVRCSVGLDTTMLRQPSGRKGTPAPAAAR